VRQSHVDDGHIENDHQDSEQNGNRRLCPLGAF
jgi:hypothetical protein